MWEEGLGSRGCALMLRPHRRATWSEARKGECWLSMPVVLSIRCWQSVLVVMWLNLLGMVASVCNSHSVAHSGGSRCWVGTASCWSYHAWAVFQLSCFEGCWLIEDEGMRTLRVSCPTGLPTPPMHHCRMHHQFAFEVSSLYLESKS